MSASARPLSIVVPASVARALRGDTALQPPLSDDEDIRTVRRLCEMGGPHLRVDLLADGLIVRHDLYLSREGLARISSSSDGSADVALSQVPVLPGILARLAQLAPTTAPPPNATGLPVSKLELEMLFDGLGLDDDADQDVAEAVTAADTALARITCRCAEQAVLGAVDVTGRAPMPLRHLFRLRRDPEGAGTHVIGGILGNTTVLLRDDVLRPVTSTDLFRAVCAAALPSRVR